MAASSNPILAERAARDPTLFCTAYKKNRFYMFTRSEPEYIFSFILSYISLISCDIDLQTEMSSTNDLLVKSRLSLNRQTHHTTRVNPDWRIMLLYILRWGISIFGYSQIRHQRPWRILWDMRGADTSRGCCSIVLSPSL
jgi:hypothetical protein